MCVCVTRCAGTANLGQKIHVPRLALKSKGESKVLKGLPKVCG